MRKDDEEVSENRSAIALTLNQILDRIDRVAERRNLRIADHQALRASIIDLARKHTTANDTCGR